MFPLPEKAAVDHLDDADRYTPNRGPDPRARASARRLRAGEDRRPQGDAGRAGARRTSSRRASRTSARARKSASTIEYQETLRLRRRVVPRCASRWSSRRATSRARSPSTASQARGWGVNTDQVPDADRITPPVAPPDDGFVNPVDDRRRAPSRLRARRTSTARTTRSTSTNRPIIATRSRSPTARCRRIATSSSSGRPMSPPRRRAAVFAEHKDGKTYALAMVVPPAPTRRRRAAEPARGRLHHRHLGLDGRNVDRAGEAGAAARARPPAARRSLQRDRIQLGDAIALRRADARRRRRRSRGRRRFVAALRARGGTEMKPALEAALDARRRARLRAPGRVPDRRRRRQRERAGRS